MRKRNIEDYITYDSGSGRYTRIIQDLYRYYDETSDPIGLATLVQQASCGRKTKEDFIRENGSYDMKKLTEFSRNVLQLWCTDVSPESYMRNYSTFEEATSAYAEEVGVVSAVDAHLSGVPVEDLLA